MKCTLALCVLAATTRIAVGADVDLPRLPAASPDGAFVTFTWRGDLWKASAEGGTATRLTIHPADESRSAWSDDGSTIAFESTRDGGRNLYLVDPMGGSLRRVTNSDEVLSLSGFGRTPTGEPALDFSASIDYDLFRAPRPYYVSLTGGEPIRRHGAFGRAAVLSPDGTRYLFERGGSDWSRRGYRGSDNCDVWMFDAKALAASAFTQLTNFQGNDGWAQWRGDSSFLFLSDQDLNTVNVFVQDAKAGASARRLTAFEGQDVKDLTVSRDGSRAFFTVWNTLYRLDLNKPGALPVALVLNAADDTFDNEETKSLAGAVSEVALNPDGKSAAVVAFGDVWIKPVEGKFSARRVTNAIAREYEISWSPDGQTLYFTSDSGGGESIMAATVATTREDVAATKNVLERKPVEVVVEPAVVAPAVEPVVEPAPAAIEPIVEPAPAAIEPIVAPAPAAIEPIVEPAPATEPAPVVAAAPAIPAPAVAPAPTATPAPSKTAKKSAEKEKPKSERWSQAVRFDVKPILAEASNDRSARPSPDGKFLAFRRGRGDIMLLDLTTNVARLVNTGWDPDIEFRWSPDSVWLAFTSTDRDFNTDIFIVPAVGDAPAINVTRHPDNDHSPRWSADGRILSFISERTNEEEDVWMVFLDKSLEALPKFELEKYFKDAGDAVKKRKPLGGETPKKKEESDDVTAKDDSAEKTDKADNAEKTDKPSTPTALSLDDAYRRVRRVSSLPGNEGSLEFAPAGDRMFFTGGDGLEGGLYSIGWDGTGQRRIGSRVNVQGISLTGDKLIVVSSGKGQLLSTSGGGGSGGGGASSASASSSSSTSESSNAGTSIDVDSSIVVDRAALSSQKFAEAARLMGENFYHPTMKNLDWDAVTARYAQLATHARTPSEFDHVANRFLGELNASHLGIRTPSVGGRTVLPQGRIGVAVTSCDKGLLIDRIIPESPAATLPTPLLLRDIITAVDFLPIVPGDTLSSRMAGTIGKEVVLTIDRTLDDGREVTFDVTIIPVTDGAIGGLAYQATQNNNAARVSELSGGRLGYIHIAGMAQPSLDEFERDLYAACEGKDGLLIDVRNNGGGWTADRLLASICSPIHAYTVPRGSDPSHTDGYPQDRLFIQRFTGPINMLCNEKSFSNAEIVAHAFKTLHRGTLVGYPTYGGVISTGGAMLLDGTSVRMPTRGWYLLNGTDMELNGAQPDIIVPQTPQDEAADSDQQLRAAVENLMQRLPKKVG